MGGREATRRENRFSLQENEWSRSYREINQHPNLPWSSTTYGFLGHFAFPEWGFCNVLQPRCHLLLFSGDVEVEVLIFIPHLRW